MMCKSLIGSLVLGVLLVQGAWSSELADALKEVAAPNQEFVRMPVSYIVSKLSRAAQKGSSPALVGVAIENELPGSGGKRITINLESMSVYDALELLATSLGGGVEYRGRMATIKDPAEVVEEEAVEGGASNVQQMSNKQIAHRRENAKRIEFTDLAKALVFVENGDARGSAFIARMDGKNYIFSNQHNFKGAVFEGSKRLVLRSMTGALLVPMSFEINTEVDLVRLGVSDEQMEGLLALSISDVNPRIGERVSVYGNSAGGDVATEIEGEVVGLGPRDIEVNASFVQGNSGSPIVNHEGEVLGVATYVVLYQKAKLEGARSKIMSGSRFSKPRRYGVRMLNAGWEKPSLKAFVGQTYTLEDYDYVMEALYTLMMYWAGDDDYETSAREIIASYSGLRRSDREPSYMFKDESVESLFRMSVRSFDVNYKEFVEILEDKLDQGSSRFHMMDEDKLRLVIQRMVKTFASGIDRINNDLDETEWMSRYLREEVRPLQEMGKMLERTANQFSNPSFWTAKKRLRR